MDTAQWLWPQSFSLPSEENWSLSCIHLWQTSHITHSWSHSTVPPPRPLTLSLSCLINTSARPPHSGDVSLKTLDERRLQRSDGVHLVNWTLCSFPSLHGGLLSVEVTACCEETLSIAVRCQISKSILILIPSVEFTLLSGPHMTPEIKI